MPLSPKLTNQFNQDIKQWTLLTKQKLAFRLASLPLNSQIEVLDKARAGRKPLARSVRSFVKKEFGQAEIIRFSFWKEGWFFDRGVGKDTPIEKAGSTKRVAKPWIDYVLEPEVDALADMILELYGDDIVDELKIGR